MKRFSLKQLMIALTLVCASMAAAKWSWELTYAHQPHKDFTLAKELAELIGR
jgi:hypothetical protein